MSKLKFLIRKSMCKKVKIVYPGDIIEVDVKAEKHNGELVLVFDNEHCWIDYYSDELKNKNAYLITKVIMNS